MVTAACHYTIFLQSLTLKITEKWESHVSRYRSQGGFSLASAIVQIEKIRNLVRPYASKLNMFNYALRSPRDNSRIGQKN